ncbi:hypothetical protein L2750_10825 [Shewanella submarina]|uniref:Uncharacterized protein n=1 Tax=Shewanella submarina TaxID=2016376 RepID=A0ABV7GGA2_9GAMM|nr:hypothetical protein [Shewanella submarina]MCL1037643.1 hypothetical protein [Shewanella submarina]
MKIIQDSRLDEFKRIEHLLYGINYEVWFNLYGPTDPDISLELALKCLISKNCEISDVIPSSPQQAISDIMKMVLHEGDIGSGPLALKSKKSEIIGLIGAVFTRISLEQADMVSEFGFKEGFPSHSVFWDFAYDIHSNGQRWIFVGSSSD